ncbi:MAG TPA: hypothetical protein EYG03_31180, partial [Planctomycetes bacterium]|nr:hypothetical protein [Planctomycetota bacterium]
MDRPRPNDSRVSEFDWKRDKIQGRKSAEVRIWSQESSDAWKIYVSDNGIGISEEFSDQVFIIFKRLHTRDEHPGTGIGLAICRRIVERHG